MEGKMIFIGYLIIYVSSEDNCLYYLLNDFEKGKKYNILSSKETNVEKNLHSIEENYLDQYIKKNIEGKFSIKMIVPVSEMDNKPFLELPILF